MFGRFQASASWTFRPQELNSWDEFNTYIDSIMLPYQGVRELVFAQTNEDMFFRQAYFADLLDKLCCQCAYQRAVFSKKAKSFHGYSEHERQIYLRSYDMVSDVWRRNAVWWMIKDLAWQPDDPMLTQDEQMRLQLDKELFLPMFLHRYVNAIAARYHNVVLSGNESLGSEFREQFCMLTRQDVFDTQVVLPYTQKDYARDLENLFKRAPRLSSGPFAVWNPFN